METATGLLILSTIEYPYYPKVIHWLHDKSFQKSYWFIDFNKYPSEF